jgi:hypothetical protein
MATATAKHFGAGIVRRPHNVPKPPPVADTCGLILEIRGASYRLARVRPQDPEVQAAWSIRKVGSTEPYTLHRDAFGLHCTCADGTYRREGTAELCKHARAMAAWGLI